jgi:hypothetical protein
VWWRRLRYVLVLIALCAIATCPAAKRSCTAKNRAQEAEDLLSVLAENVGRTLAQTGHVPPLPAGPSPQPSCCDREGGVCEPEAGTFDTPAWRALGFSIDDPYRYTYQYVPAADGKSAVIRAVGDLDCDGKSSLYEVKVDGKRTWTRRDPYE